MSKNLQLTIAYRAAAVLSSAVLILVALETSTDSSLLSVDSEAER